MTNPEEACLKCRISELTRERCEKKKRGVERPREKHTREAERGEGKERGREKQEREALEKVKTSEKKHGRGEEERREDRVGERGKTAVHSR
jgi:hypothetical protein